MILPRVLISMCIHAQLPQLCLTFCDPMDCSPQAPLSMRFSGQECGSELPRPPSGDLLDSGIELASLSLLLWQVGYLPLVPPEKPWQLHMHKQII